MKLSIIAEGGSMRGAYVVGAVDALYSYFGLKHADCLIGSSASAATLAYYAAGQFYPGYYIWTDEATNPRFLSMSNLLKGRPLLDIDYMVDEVFKKKIPLDSNNLKNSKMHLIIPLTNARTGKPHYIDNKSNEDFFEILRAATAAPFVYGKLIKIKNERYFDGSFSDALPIEHPSVKNSRKIIILTRPDYDSQKINIEKFLSGMLKWKLEKGVFKALKEYSLVYNEHIERINKLEKNGDIIIRPSKKISRFNNSNKAILASIRHGYNDVVSNRKILQLIKDMKTSREGRRYFNQPPKHF